MQFQKVSKPRRIGVFPFSLLLYILLLVVLFTHLLNLTTFDLHPAIVLAPTAYPGTGCLRVNQDSRMHSMRHPLKEPICDYKLKTSPRTSRSEVVRRTEHRETADIEVSIEDMRPVSRRTKLKHHLNLPHLSPRPPIFSSPFDPPTGHIGGRYLS